jgi:hypothetical protein
MRMIPEAPPKPILVWHGIFSRCFWRQCEFQWVRRNRSWTQQVCCHCGATGETVSNAIARHLVPIEKGGDVA